MKMSDDALNELITRHRLHREETLLAAISGAGDRVGRRRRHYLNALLDQRDAAAELTTVVDGLTPSDLAIVSCMNAELAPEIAAAQLGISEEQYVRHRDRIN